MTQNSITGLVALAIVLITGAAHAKICDASGNIYTRPSKSAAVSYVANRAVKVEVEVEKGGWSKVSIVNEHADAGWVPTSSLRCQSKFQEGYEYFRNGGCFRARPDGTDAEWNRGFEAAKKKATNEEMAEYVSVCSPRG